jgi:peptide/nickel transport system ATP-binding protein
MLLEVNDLNVTVGDGGGRGTRRVAMLRDVSFSVAPGRILGLVGESGAGKSMIGRVIAGLLPPNFHATAGQFNFAGEALLTLSAERRRALLGDRIAFIPQEPLSALNPVLTIGQQFDEHLARLGVPRSQRRAHAARALGEVRLVEPGELLDRYPFQLSGGMCQRVLIAMAFSSDPALIIADEPTTALDVTIQAQILALVLELQRELGMGLILITHDLGVVAQTAQRVIVMYAGRKVEEADVETLFAHPLHPYTSGLMASIPAVPTLGTKDNARLVEIPGMVPSLSNLPAGCAFAPRCARAIPRCREEYPPIESFGPGHLAACWRAGESVSSP